MRTYWANVGSGLPHFTCYSYRCCIVFNVWYLDTVLRLAQLCAAKKACAGRNCTLSSLIRNMSAEQGCGDSVRMQKSRFADAKPGRTLNRLTTQLRSRCALIGQDRVKAEVQRAGDSPREVPSSSVLCKTHARARARAHTHYRTLPGVWYLCITGLDCVGVKTNWDF